MRGGERKSTLPQIGESSPELRVVGKIKAKKQDICIVPNIDKKREDVDTYMGKEIDNLGINFIKHTLIINVRSQIVSIAKNTDTILERTFAETINLNLRDDDIISGEFFLLPIKEVIGKDAKKNVVAYKCLPADVIEKYINFF